MCGDRFDVSLVSEAAQARRGLTYGVVAIDGDGATLGAWTAAPDGSGREPRAVKVAHVASNIASRTRRGGSSAGRYSRNRDGEELAFLRKVGGLIREHLGDVRGLVLGGRADMKRKLLAELPGPLRTRVARVVDLGCAAGEGALGVLAAQLGEVLAGDQRQGSDDALRRFMDLASAADAGGATAVCYGEAETLAALRLGAAERVLVAAPEAWRLHGDRAALCRAAAASGAEVTEVGLGSGTAVRFCEGFGVAACLRYAVDLALLEAATEEEESPAEDPQKTHAAAPAGPADADSDAASTAASRTDRADCLSVWLQGVLQAALQDASAAESLAMCAEVVLFDESTPAEERVESAVEMLRGEGVPDGVLAELTCRALDRLAATAE